MKRILAVILFFAAATSLALSQTADQQEKAKGEKAGVKRILLQMEHDGNEATVKKDVATLSKLLADDWIGQSPDGIQTKAQAMAELKSEYQKFDSITLGDMKVRVFGDTAIVTGSLDAKSTYKGKDTSGHLLWIDVFAKRQGRWQDVASQTTPIAKQ